MGAFGLAREAWRAARACRRRRRVFHGLAQGLRAAGLSEEEVRLLMRYARETDRKGCSTSPPGASALTEGGYRG
ncbi:hypothetical protein H5T53_08240 [Candidatus Bipolaricaulota bacterium]|nr:hypothetical protein [Candidatus Bipolaricaulota bacterium]